MTTIVLGIGSNLGNPLHHLRQAVQKLKKLSGLQIKKISPVYFSQALLPEHAPADWNKPYLNIAVSGNTTLTPQDLLSALKRIEIQLGRQQTERWAPRIIDIDILVWGNQVYQENDLHIPHPQLLQRPFALWPLLDVMPDWKHPLESTPLIPWHLHERANVPLQTQRTNLRIDPPYLTGVLNLTPNSISGDGHFNDVERAVMHAQQLFAAGAEIIDVGAESTRAGAAAVSPEEEWRRLQPVLNDLSALWKDATIKPKISIDTRHAQVAEKALRYDIAWINDVSGEELSAMASLLAGTSVKYVTMHHLGVPVVRGKNLPVNESAMLQVYVWAQQRLAELMQYGFSAEQIILDLGIGYGKTPQQSLQLIKHVREFKLLNVPLLLGPSRKRFLNIFTDGVMTENDIVTATLAGYLAGQGVDYLRIHNVAWTRRAVDTIQYLHCI